MPETPPDPRRTVQLLGIVWYREQDYPAVLRIMADANLLPRTFQQWHQIASQTESRLRAEGRMTVRAILDPATFPAWCRQRGLQVNAAARNTFAAEQAYLKGRS